MKVLDQILQLKHMLTSQLFTVENYTQVASFERALKATTTAYNYTCRWSKRELTSEHVHKHVIVVRLLTLFSLRIQTSRSDNNPQLSCDNCTDENEVFPCN